jgi:hypothetical protein
MQAPELFPDHGRTRRGSLAFELHDQRPDLPRQRVGVTVGSATAIGQSGDAAVLAALEDLVAGLARDVELAAQPRHPPALEDSADKPQALIHPGTLLPGAFGGRRVQKCRQCARPE